MKILIELHYLPNLAFFSAVSQAETLVLEACENYQKQSFRNRCYLLGANKTQCLTVPVRHLARQQPIREVQIDYSQRWQQVHLRAMASAYGKAPFFEEFFPAFEHAFDAKPDFLFAFNLQLLTTCLYCLQWKKNLVFTEKYIKTVEAGTIDLRNWLLPGKGDKSAEIYQLQPYPQVFGKEFVPNLSILDVLFAEGAYAGAVLAQSAFKDKAGIPNKNHNKGV